MGKANYRMQRDNSHSTQRVAAETEVWPYLAPGAKSIGAAAAYRARWGRTHITQQPYYFTVGRQKHTCEARTRDAARAGENGDGFSNVVTKRFQQKASIKIHHGFSSFTYFLGEAVSL